jgi:aminopeptidase N
MDEGFANWATDLVTNFYNETVIRKREANTPGARERLDSLNNQLPKYHYNNYNTYFYIAKSRLEEPLTTHADHYETNTAYSIAAYSKGCVFLSQLGYIVGEQNLADIMLEYYKRWRFRHPTDDDFLRVAEDVSGLQLDWYKDYWINSVKTIDYSIDSLWEEGGKTKIRLKRIGEIPMPQDVMIRYKDGTSELAYIPAYMMFGNKPEEDKNVQRTVFPAWKWTHNTYTFEIPKRIATIKVIELDETKRMADVERRNNRLEIPW